MLYELKPKQVQGFLTADCVPFLALLASAFRQSATHNQAEVQKGILQVAFFFLLTHLTESDHK